jgi:sporulation protein YlmC with PRC-barrel domain
VTLQSLLDKRVLTTDGDSLGRVFDFRARREGSEIRVTHIRVGIGAWIARLHPYGGVRRLFGSAPGLEIPWEAVASVDQEVRLEEGWDRTRCEACLIQAEESIETDEQQR